MSKCHLIIRFTFLLLLVAASTSKVNAQDYYTQIRDSYEDSVQVADFPGAWNLPGTAFYLKFGGYFKIDAIYDFNGSGSRNQLLMSQIAVDGSPESSAGPFFNMHLRETRFNFDLRRTTPKGRAFKFFLEFDFFDESLGAGQPRLRHAFVKYGNLTVGQTWSNLSDLRVFPFIIDFAFGDALFGGRSVQVKWEQDIAKHFNYGVSVEMPGMNGIADPFQLGGEPMSLLPIFSGRLTNNRENGMIMVGAQFEQLRWDGRDSISDATALGWAAVLNARQNIGKRFFVTCHASYSKGLTDHVLVFAGTDEGAVLDQKGDIQVEDAITLALGGGFQISNALTANIAYAFMERGDLKYRPPNTIDNGGIGHVNIIWSLDENAKLGLEYAWGEVEDLNRKSGDASRIQAMARYSF